MTTYDKKPFDLPKVAKPFDLSEVAKPFDLPKVEVLTIDLSLMFNENGYIDKCNNNKYAFNVSVTNIILIQSDNSPVKIGDNFLSHYIKLISVDTSRLVNVIAIGNAFLYDCPKLVNFTINGLTSLITIGEGFLQSCKNLENFDMTGLISLTEIKSNFLYDCCNLKKINLIGLISLSNIKSFFLFDCNDNLTVTITIKNSSLCLQKRLSRKNCQIVQLL